MEVVPEGQFFDPPEKRVNTTKVEKKK